MLTQAEAENPRPYDICTIIFRHQAAFYKFSPFWEDCLYYIEDDRLNDPKEWENKDTFTEIFINNILEALKSSKSIFVLDYNPMSALCLMACIEKIQKEKHIKFFCMAFFHDDQTTSSIVTDFDDNTSSDEYLMDAKFEIIKSMINFPFIKKYEIPIFYEISKQYLADLVKEQIDMSN